MGRIKLIIIGSLARIFFSKICTEKLFLKIIFRKKVSNYCCEYALISMDNIISDVSCTLGGGLCV